MSKFLTKTCEIEGILIKHVLKSVKGLIGFRRNDLTVAPQKTEQKLFCKRKSNLDGLNNASFLKMSNKRKLLGQTPETTQHRNITSQSRNTHYATSPSGLSKAIPCRSLSLIVSDLTVGTKKHLMVLSKFKKKVGDKIISYQKFLPLLHLLLSPSLFSSFQLPSVCLSFSSSFCLSRGQPVDGKLISVSRNPCGCTFYTHLLCVCVCAAMFW